MMPLLALPAAGYLKRVVDREKSLAPLYIFLAAAFAQILTIEVVFDTLW